MSSVREDRTIFTPFKKYEYILNNKHESFEKKIQSLVEVWRTVCKLNLSQSDIRYIIQIMDWAKLHTLNIVLTAEWKDYKGKYEGNLICEIEKAQCELLKLNSAFLTRCQKLANVVRNPWEDPILERLLSSKDATIGPDEIEFFCVETAYLVSVRLKKLCESQCEDLALNLVTAFMNCNKLAKAQNFSLNATETQMWFIFDIYIALLYKFQENQKIVALLKELTLDEGLQLIRRFAKKRVKISKIWRHCQRVAILASQVFVSTAAVKFSEEHREILENLVDCFISICNTESLIENFTKSLRRISQLADAAGLYVFCHVVHRKAGLKLKPFTIEMYIRALTTDLNNLERQKHDNETDKIADTMTRLAGAFCKLADLLDEHVNVARECILTAFSIEPSLDRLKQIEDLARRSGFNVLDTGQMWKCKKHPPVLPSDDIAWTCPDCGDWMCKPQLTVPLNTNTALSEALTSGALGISPQLCDDLAVCLSNPRYQILSWLLDWPDLHRLCVMYLNDPERTKNIVTDLKFVDIDYSMFKGIKREPVDELAGIERGYEQYLDYDFASDDQLSTISEDSASQDSRPYSLGSDGAGDTPSLSLLPSLPKSDPNTLKSLRMFRPNLKRSRHVDPGPTTVPTKLPKADPSTYLPPKPIYLPGNFAAPTGLNNTGESGVPIPIPYTGYTNRLPNVPPDRANQNHVPYYSNVSPFNQDPASKNGLVATLPPHGGQVAINDMTHTQDLQPPSNINPLCQISPLPPISTPSNYLHNGVPRGSTTKIGNKSEAIINPAVPTSLHITKPNNILHNKPFSLKDHSLPINIPLKPYTGATKKNPSKHLNNKSLTPNKDHPQCNTFKGISVQDIINKTIGKCDEQSCTKNGYVDDLLVTTQSDKEEDIVVRNDSQVEVSQKLKKNNLELPKENVSSESDDSSDDLPKNKHLTENIRTSKARKNIDDKDYVIIPRLCLEESVRLCRNVNIVLEKLDEDLIQKQLHQLHSSSKIQTRELRIVLQRITYPPKTATSTISTSPGSDKGEVAKKRGRKRKIIDKSENQLYDDIAPKRVQNKTSSPLQDINPRVPSEQRRKPVDLDPKRTKFFCDELNPLPDSLNPWVMLERLPMDNRFFARSVLANVPGLNDFELLQPSHVDQIVNVVQISGGRTQSTVPTVQNTQTSTQVSPHIQRIGQPRSDKPETNTDPVTTSTTSFITTTTTTTVKATTSQPSTLINILSQQFIRPGQSNCVRTRPSPLINILSQQIVRPTTVTQLPAKTTTVTNEQVNNVSSKATTEQSTVTQVSPVKNSTTTTVKSITGPPTGSGTILQFICKSTLPKFQQAFGKTVYQNSTTETSETPSTNSDTPVDPNKKTQTKNIPLNVQPIQGGVIYTRQMPVGQAINLIPPGRGQVFRIATSNADQISLVKDTVIHSKMSALLAAALQGKPKTSEIQEGETNDGVVTRPTLVQNARIVKPVLQIPSNVIRTSPQSNLSSTTLEQLREFDMVYKQIKERSSTSTPSETSQTETTETTSQRISVTYVNQGQKYTQISPVVVVSSYCNLQPAASPALSVTSQGSSSPCVTPAPTPAAAKVSPAKSSKGKTLKSTTTHTSKSSPIPKPQQKPQEDEHTTQRIFDILAEYAEQLRNSPDLNNKPAPRRRSNPPTNPNQNSKRKKSSSSSKKSGQCSSIPEGDNDERTIGSEDSSCGVVQLSVQEDEQPQVQSSVQTTESNDSSSNNSRQLILTESAGNNQTRNLIIADSSVGEALKMPNTAVLVPGNYIMPVSMVKGGQQIAVVSGGSKILATVPARSGPNMLLFQSFLNQNRKPGVPTVKYSTIQPLTGISSQSLAGVSAQPPVILPSNAHNLTAVTLGQPLTLKKIEDSDRVNHELLLTISQPRETSKTTPIQQPADSSTNSNKSEDNKPDSVIQDGGNDGNGSASSEKVFSYQKTIITAPIATPVIAQTAGVSVKEATSEEPATTQSLITMNISTENLKDEKPGERVQSVLVTACTSNGPMLSHTPPRYRKPSETSSTNNDVSNKEEFLHNGEKQNNSEQKNLQGTTVYYTNKTRKAAGNNSQRLDRELHQLCLQRKQAALERELRLQKSLSEECEDLGVDEPSTSDLFPEADLLFDSNHSPSFDQTSQDLVKRPAAVAPPAIQVEIKEETKSAMTLFSDDDENSSSLRTDLFEYVEYQTAETELEYDQNQQITNGQSSTTSNESGSSCEDNTLLQNCASMSDVTLNSPISPDAYTENTPPSLNKYKYKYSNRKKGERLKQTENWTVEVSSSEDTTGSTELAKSASHSPEPCSNKHSQSISCDDELSDGSFKVVRVAIAKTNILKDEETCEGLHCGEDDDCSPSGRGARRSVKKMCSCCNGSQEGAGSRKRPTSTSRPHTPASHKKAFLNKKR